MSYVSAIVNLLGFGAWNAFASPPDQPEQLFASAIFWSLGVAIVGICSHYRKDRS